MSRDWNQEIANIEWGDVLVHVAVGMAVAAGVITISSMLGIANIGVIIGLAFNWLFWPAREMWQTGRFGVRGWSVKKWVEGFSAGVVVTPFMVMFI